MKTITSIVSAIVVIFVCMLIADQGTFQIAVNGNNIIDLVYIAIFVFIVYFFITRKTCSPKAQKEIITAIIVYCCFNVYLVFTNFGVMCIKKAPYSVKTKACWSNIRVIQGAVEMYNMDMATMATTLDIPELIKGKYLTTEPMAPEKDCCYDSCGDLSNDGFVFCYRHLIPEIRQEEIEQIQNGNFHPTEKLPQELIDKIQKLKGKIKSKQTFMDKANLAWKDNSHKLKDILSPFLVLFFPFTLHPLRN